MSTITISCETCVMQATSACRDCVVTFLCGDDEVVLDATETVALRRLAEAGLAPPLRHRAAG